MFFQYLPSYSVFYIDESTNLSNNAHYQFNANNSHLCKPALRHRAVINLNTLILRSC